MTYAPLSDPDPPHQSGASRLLSGRSAALLVVLLGAAFTLPFIGRCGLWDPQEVRLLEQARDVTGFTVPERLARPPLPLLAAAVGMRVLGMGELGGRLPVALAALMTLAAVVALGAQLGRRRAGSLAALLLLSVPVFALGARQATTHLYAVLGQTLAMLGLSALWPAAEERPWAGGRPLLWGLGAAGLTIGFLSAGAPLGVTAPLLAAAVAFALCGGPRPQIAILSALAGASLIQPLRLCLASAQLPSGARLGTGIVLLSLGLLCLVADTGADGRRRVVLGPLLGALGLGLLPALPQGAYGYSPWFAGFARWPPNREIQVDSLLRPLGFQLFPWAAILPLGVVALLSSRDAERLDRVGPAGPAPEPPADPLSETAAPVAADPVVADPRDRLADVLPLSWFALTYLLATYQAALTTEPPFPALAALALVGGLYLDRALDGAAGGRLSGLAAALISLLLGRDLFLNPEQYGGAHFPGDLIRWPAPLLWVTQALVAFSALFGVVLGLGLALGGALRRRLLYASLGVGLVASLISVYALVPAVSAHVSYRGVFTKYKQLGGGALGIYGVPRSGARVYDQQSVELTSLPGVLEFLGKDASKRAFVLVGAQELAALDQLMRQRQQTYYVVDDSNVQFLLLSNQLAAKETDLNPLRRLVLDKEPHPQHALKARFEDRLELLGYDLPDELSRGGDFTIRLYFKVLQPVGGSYKVFLHFDGAGTRWNGDHVPLDGKFPTQYWSQGYYIIDEHHMSTSRMAQPAGVYQVYAGLWPGGDAARIRVSEGPQDGDNRVKLGVVKVK